MKAQIVSFHCVLKDKLGQVLSSSFNQDVINQLDDGAQNTGAAGLRGLVAGIQNVHQGERRFFTVPAIEAYGPYRPELVLRISKGELPARDQPALGDEILIESGTKTSSRLFRVVEIEGDTLVLDGNHPFAGQDLTFEIEVVSAREARKEDFQDSFSTHSRRYLH